MGWCDVDVCVCGWDVVWCFFYFSFFFGSVMCGEVVF